MFFPFRDHNPSRRLPFVTWGLIALNIIVFLLYAPLLSDQMALAAFFDDWALVSDEVTQGQETYTLITHMFLHGGFMHLAGNMLFLYIYGDNIEDQLGHLPFLLFYLACGFGAAFLQILPDVSSQVPMVGASGAIAGVMGAYLLMFPRARIDILFFIVVFFRIFTLPAFIVLGFWIAMQFVGGFGTPTGGGGVAYWAHVGGFIAGIALITPLWLRKGGPNFWTRTDYHPPHAETFATAPTSIPAVQRRRR